MIPGYYVVEGKEVRVAISGRSGCGNTTVSRILAETLDIAFINFYLSVSRAGPSC